MNDPSFKYIRAGRGPGTIRTYCCILLSSPTDMFAERIEGRAPLTIPASLTALTNNFILEGVVTLLHPPSEILTRWVNEDQTLSEQERASMLDFIAITDGRAPHGQGHTVLPKFDIDAREHEPLKEKTAMFGAALANRFHGYVLETLLPLFLDGHFAIDPREPIVIVRKFHELQSQIEESLHDFVLWVETQLESPDAEQVVREINGLAHWDVREQTVDILMARNDYKRVRVRTVKERLMRTFSSNLDKVIEDVAENLKSGMNAALLELAEKDKAAIPGPRHLE